MSDLHQLSAQQFLEGIVQRDTVITARAITLLESAQPAHRELAEQILALCLPHSGKSLRIGISGAPGVGKSSFIESWGKLLLTKNKRIAVLAVDPSSRKSKGSILGDKTRMQQLAKEPGVYIRPTPSGTTLGGVASSTRESILLLEAAGYDIILVETVGVGQSETAVYDMTDIFILLLMAGAGDELQGIKRGIMEMADLIAINKCDGDNIVRAQAARAEFQRALHLFQEKESGWQTSVFACSALTGDGLEAIWEEVEKLSASMMKGYLQQRRKAQYTQWFDEELNEALLRKLAQKPGYPDLLAQFTQQVNEGTITPSAAARALANALLAQ